MRPFNVVTKSVSGVAIPVRRQCLNLLPLPVCKTAIVRFVGHCCSIFRHCMLVLLVGKHFSTCFQGYRHDVLEQDSAEHAN